ncbi:MAG: PRC-barrel domain containing protein [Candidatus Limnocylindria bacterium]
MEEVWTYRDKSALGSTVIDTHADLTGFTVEALDGSIGKVDEATYDVGRSFLVVDTGPWIFGKKVMLPAGVIGRIDTEARKVFLDRTKEQIKNAPEFDEARLRDTTYREDLGTYYGRGGPGFRERR